MGELEVTTLGDNWREDGVLSRTDASLHLATHRLPTDLGLEATLLAAVAEDLIIIYGDMPQLTGEA